MMLAVGEWMFTNETIKVCCLSLRGTLPLEPWKQWILLVHLFVCLLMTIRIGRRPFVTDVADCSVTSLNWIVRRPDIGRTQCLSNHY